MRFHHLLFCFATIALNFSPVQSVSGSQNTPDNDQSTESSHNAEECAQSISTVQCAHINQDEVAPLDAFQAHLPRNVDDAQQDTLYTATNPHIQQPHLTPETPPYGTDNRTSDLASLTTAVTSHPPAVLNVSIHVPQMAPNSTEKFQEEQFTSGNKGEKSGHDGNYQDSWSGTWSKAPTAISALGAVGIILVLSPDRKRKQRHSTPEVPDDGNKNDTADPYRDTSGPIDRKRIKLGHRTLQEAVERDQSYKCKPITVEQLIAEVKGIYAGLVMVETKCIEVDNTLAASDAELNSEQWQALVALHKTLLHEHHDFLLASQHPSASPALRRLARKYAMPARMWRHGIHSFLELLRHRLPHSLEHMLRFIYIAYTMMALLYETVPAYEDTWIECLGDLGRYRMAIEDEDIRDREVWTRVSRYWYSRASYNAPGTGRLYHHLAILCRPNPMRQLLYYTKSLCAPIPFLAARDSILTVSGFGNPAVHLSTPDATFLQAHAILFAQRDYENFEGVMESFVQCLEGDQSQIEVKPFISSRHPLALITCNSIVGYGDESRFLLRLKTESDLTCGTEATGNDDIETDTAQLKQLDHACTLAERIDTTLMLRVGDPDILEYLHVRLIFMLLMARNPSAMTYLSKRFPWDLAAMCLNAIAMSIPPTETFSTESFPKPIDEDGHVLSEDWEMRGLFWTENYFPEDWFTGEADFYSAVDGYKQPAPAMYREQRVLFVGRCLAQSLAPLLFDPELNSFISTLEEPPAESGLSISQNTKAEVSMVSMSEIGITVGELDTEGAVNLWLTQSTSLTRTRQEMSQPIAKQSDVAAISPTTSSVDKSTEITFEGPRRDFTCMATSENTEASSTHHTEENAVVATTSHSHGTKNNSLTPTTQSSSLTVQKQTDCITVIPREIGDHTISQERHVSQVPLTEYRQTERATVRPLPSPTTSPETSTTEESPPIGRHGSFGQPIGFPCAHCTCVFRRACDLKKHASKHTKPFKCSVDGCHKPCSTRRDLNRHQMAKHPEKFYRGKIPCDVPECGRLFARRDHMVRHRRAFHSS